MNRRFPTELNSPFEPSPLTSSDFGAKPSFPRLLPPKRCRNGRYGMGWAARRPAPQGASVIVIDDDLVGTTSSDLRRSLALALYIIRIDMTLSCSPNFWNAASYACFFVWNRVH